MVEPFWSDTTPEGAMKAIGIAAALGTTSAYTWLKVPIVPSMKRVMAATTLPSLVLGGGGPARFEAWEARARDSLPCRGSVVGRSLLYPDDDDVATSSRYGRRPGDEREDVSTTALETINHVIGGAETAGASTRTAPVYDPATGQVARHVLLGEPADVDAAVQAARAAFDDAGATRRSCAARG